MKGRTNQPRRRGRWFTGWNVWVAATFIAGMFFLSDAAAWLQSQPHISFRDLAICQLPRWSVWWFIFPLILWLRGRLPVDARRWYLTVLVHVVMAGGFTFLLLAAEALRRVLANHLPLDYFSRVLRDLVEPGLGAAVPALLYFSTVLALYAAAFYRDWRAGQQLALELSAANAQLDSKLVLANLNALKMQLQPHFLFNTLNSITALIRTGSTREAEDVTAGLGELLRRLLDHKQEMIVPLEREIDFLRRYLEIERMRFKNRLRFEIEVAPECLVASVPNLVLQPLVENAMKHGISRDARAQLLRISARRDGLQLVLEVFNDGPPLTEPVGALSNGIGLQNVRARLGIMYGPGSSLVLRNEPAGGVTAEIRLPATNFPQPT